MREEQAQARVTPRQAIPFFFDKLTKLCGYLKPLLFSPSSSPGERYVLARDLVFFCLEFYTGVRASDLGRVLTREVACLPAHDGRFPFPTHPRGGGGGGVTPTHS